MEETLKKYFERYQQSLEQAIYYAKTNIEVRKQLEKLKTAIVQTKMNGGKIIFTGIGKNVFACQKLAASYSSIGIPTFFLDAVHAVHGDLGIVGDKDLIIAMSKSGNTSELTNMLEHLQWNLDRFPSPVWGLDCGKLNNGFDNLCDETIHLYVPMEIDEMNLVPTVSAIMLQIAGDLVGVAAAEQLGLNSEIYGYNHPGGTIGKTLKK
jgi:arabinose-5-phosphate isomerase